MITTKYAQASLNNMAFLPKPNAANKGIIGVMQVAQYNLSQKLTERVQHCVGQILHSRKLGAATRLLRSQNELQALVKKWGNVEFKRVCFDMGITPKSLA